MIHGIHTAYKVDGDKRLPVGAGYSTSATDFTPSTQALTATTLMFP